MFIDTQFSQAREELKSVADFIRFAATQFGRAELYYGHGTDNAWDEAVAIVLQLLELPSDYPQSMLGAVVLDGEKEHLMSGILQRITERKPLSYITNKAYFCELEFFVDERVLVPRSPIGELIKHEFQPWLQAENCENGMPRVLDLCCGSGCIGMAIAAYMPSEVVLSDISYDALEVASINQERLGLFHNTQLIHSDGFTQLEGERFDLIVSNPPYVDLEDLSDMPNEFHHEPEIGLGSGNDGLDLTRKILEQARNHLTDNGLLIVEVGNSWPALDAAYPELDFHWIEFEHGGDGVFLFHKAQLDTYFNA